MSRNFRTAILGSAALAAVSASGARPAPRPGDWDPGEPVVTYWYGPGCCRNGRDYIPLDDFWAKQIKEGGFNTVWATRPEELDLAARYGFRVIYALNPEKVWAKYFMNLGIARLHAAALKIPLWNGIQACSWTPGSAASPPTVRVPNLLPVSGLRSATSSTSRSSAAEARCCASSPRRDLWKKT